MEKVNSGILTATTMKDFGLMTRLTDRACISQPTDRATSANGKMTCNMDMEKRPGPINHHTKDHIT